MRNYQRERGTSLVEIIVSILVMAIGLLGLAGLQANALKYQKTASQRTEAMQAAYDITERMRANWVGGLASNYAATRSANLANYRLVQTYATATSSTHDTVANACNTAMTSDKAIACSATQIAAKDLQEWQRSIELRLNGGAGRVVPVTGTTATTASFDITVMWKESTLTTGDTNCPSNDRPVGVRCFTVRYSI